MKLDWTDAIRCHYEKHWKVPGKVSSLPPGPIGQVLPSFKVLEFPRHPGRSLWTYATVGMSLPSDERHIELHMFTQIRSESNAMLLAMAAYYHRTGEQLGLWHTVNFGCPWLALSECTCGLISLPYLDGPALEDLETEHGL